MKHKQSQCSRLKACHFVDNIAPIFGEKLGIERKNGMLFEGNHVLLFCGHSKMVVLLFSDWLCRVRILYVLELSDCGHRDVKIPTMHIIYDELLHKELGSKVRVIVHFLVHFLKCIPPSPCCGCLTLN